MKIHSLSIENTKRIKAVTLEPAANGLTVIGGRNGQGKTSVLDVIAWALGGDRYKPTNAHREGSVLPPQIRVTLDNGLVVERKGKNSALTVTDPSGRKAGQQLLNEFINELALNLPKFMRATDKEKASTLLQIIGVGEELAAIEREESAACSERLALGRIADQKAAFVKSLPYHVDAPKEPVSAAELLRRHNDILARNAENQRRRSIRDELYAARNRMAEKLQDLQRQMDEAAEQYAAIGRECEIADRNAQDLQDESTEAIQRDLDRIDEINRKVRANLDHDKAEEDAREAANAYNALTAKIDGLRRARIKLLEGAKLPLDGLSVEKGCLLYKGKAWDCMSASEQLRVSTAIVRALNPKCGFVLMDALEQMDRQTLYEFGEWLADEGLQVIATRVSDGDECQIIIEDGKVASDCLARTPQQPPAVPMRDWRNEGGFGK